MKPFESVLNRELEDFIAGVNHGCCRKPTKILQTTEFLHVM